MSKKPPGSAGVEIQFSLYTKINENQTKSLKKSSTNKQERINLSEIFDLKTDTKDGKPIKKTDLLLQDYHYINYEFCKENQFSNEKISTFLTIMDHILHYMLDKQRQTQDGLKLLKKLLYRHCRQRPPFQIFIFSEEDIVKIIEFSMKTLFRHYSLYEFSFKPRVELILKCEPVHNQNHNAPLHGLEDMKVVEGEEAEKMQGFLALLNSDIGDMQLEAPFQAEFSPAGSDAEEGEEEKEEDEEEQEQVPEIDWKKVGKLYDPGTDVETVVAREMGRMKKLLEKEIVKSDQKVEEKIVAAKGSTKKK